MVSCLDCFTILVRVVLLGVFLALTIIKVLEWSEEKVGTSMTVLHSFEVYLPAFTLCFLGNTKANGSSMTLQDLMPENLTNVVEKATFTIQENPTEELTMKLDTFWVTIVGIEPCISFEFPYEAKLNTPDIATVRNNLDFKNKSVFQILRCKLL